MSLRNFSFTLVVGCFALVGASRAETVSFPKEIPAFTVDLSKGAEAKVESGTLTIRLFKYGSIGFSAVPATVHDDASARAWLAGALSSYMDGFYAALERPKAPDVPEERRAFGPKAQGFSVEANAGNLVEVDGMTLQTKSYMAAVFTLDGKRYFSLWADYDLEMDSLLKKKSHLVEFWEERDRIIGSIAPVK